MLRRGEGGRRWRERRIKVQNIGYHETQIHMAFCGVVQILQADFHMFTKAMPFWSFLCPAFYESFVLTAHDL